MMTIVVAVGAVAFGETNNSTENATHDMTSTERLSPGMPLYGENIVLDKCYNTTFVGEPFFALGFPDSRRVPECSQVFRISLHTNVCVASELIMVVSHSTSLFYIDYFNSSIFCRLMMQIVQAGSH